MSSASEAISGEADVPPAHGPGKLSPLAPFLWSVRREVWEHKSLYVAPVAIAGLVFLGALLAALKAAGRFHAQLDISPDQAMAVRMAAFGASAFSVVIVSGAVAFFYCLGALNNERRDRSILFWKSLPVSDLNAVLAKAAVPLLVLPAFVFVVVIALHTLLLVLAAVSAVIFGGSQGLMGVDVRMLQIWALLLYGLAAITLWYAPIYGWLLMVSAWAKRGPFLWAVLPPLALALVERLMVGTNYLGHLLHQRIGGFVVGFRDGSASFHAQSTNFLNPLSIADPAGLVSSPGLWGGLAAAAVFIAATVWLRQNRDPA